MSRWFNLYLLLLMLLPFSTAQSTELTGRFSILGLVAQAEQGDIGFVDPDHDTLTADQQSLRLMLDDIQDIECSCVQGRLNRREASLSILTERLSRLKEAENDS